MSKNQKVEAGEVVVTVSASELWPAPAGLEAEGRDKLIVLRWEDSPTAGYSGYHVDRFDDSSKTYQRLTNRPIVALIPEKDLPQTPPQFYDTTIENNRRYRYRVRGITPFGELGLPAEVEARGRDLTPPPAPKINPPVQIGAAQIKLAWEMAQAPTDLSGFKIDRSANAFGDTLFLFDELLPVSARQVVDSAATEDEPYYRVAAIDSAGNVAPSPSVYATFVDSLPPSIPTGFMGQVDSNGVVRLHWHPNPEKDILGYRVLWANSSGHEFSQLTSTLARDTAFVDTISVNTLTRHVYYRLAAVDRRYNHSTSSAILALRRPDHLPPEPCVFTEVAVTDSAVALAWAPSTSEDLQWQVLYRRQSGEPEQKELARFAPQINQFVDHAVTPNVTYEYTLVAIDSTGLRSEPSMPVQGRPYDTGWRPPVKDFSANYDADAHKVLLQWAYEASAAEKFSFWIYRAAPDAGLQPYHELPSSERRFEDTKLDGDGTYEYAVQVVASESAAESPLSARVRVEVQKR
jgi:fibronectin type 3 domain-containing protein